MNQSDIIIFTTDDEQVELNVRLEDDGVADTRTNGNAV